jgi:hypothetical protein
MSKKISYFQKNGKYLTMKEGKPISFSKQELNTYLKENNCNPII